MSKLVTPNGWPAFGFKQKTVTIKTKILISNTTPTWNACAEVRSTHALWCFFLRVRLSWLFNPSAGGIP